MTRDRAVGLVKAALAAEAAAIAANDAADAAFRKAQRACREAAGVTVPRFDRRNILPGEASAIWREAAEQFEAQDSGEGR